MLNSRKHSVVFFKSKCLLLFVFVVFSLHVKSSVYQWSVPVSGFLSSEINDHPNAFMWIPENCQQVRAVVFSQQNMCEEAIFDHPAFRETMAELGFAIIWIAPGIDYQWDVKSGCQEAFVKMMNDFAHVSGYSELTYAPVVPLGHSAMATFPWNFAAWNPERTLAVISYKGDAPRTNLTGYGRENLEWGRTRNIDGIPGLMIEGEYEWWEARVYPALAFRMMYPESCVSFLCDTGHGHFDVSDDVVEYLSLFLKKAAQFRLPKIQALDTTVQLSKLNVRNGWLAERWQAKQKKRAKAAAFEKYKGDMHDAFWYFDKEIAETTESYYQKHMGKQERYIGFIQNGNLLSYNNHLHARITAPFQPQTDGLTFNCAAVFTDSLRSMKARQSEYDKPIITKICGPVEKVNDTTFTVRFYRMGLTNKKRTGDIWLMASHAGNKESKSAVQQFNLKIPTRNNEGEMQTIDFTELKNIPFGTASVNLEATASSGLPVYYYVKEGPAIIEGNQLKITSIPPRSKFPLKVTVVAWQYGRNIEPKFQSANPVERTFYISKH